MAKKNKIERVEEPPRKIEEPPIEEPVIDDPLQEPESDPAEGGQSGDLQGLSGVATADSESVRELVEEGNYFEAGVVSGVENAPLADSGTIKTRERPEDDVPFEYMDTSDEPKE